LKINLNAICEWEKKNFYFVRIDLLIQMKLKEMEMTCLNDMLDEMNVNEWREDEVNSWVEED
jgi:hypothetical protein